MEKQKNFWDKNAGRYDCFMRKDAAAYEQMYELLRPVVRHKTVLELATGTGLIAKNIVNSAAHIEATDASPEMIAEAKRDNRSAKLHFSGQDMFHLPYAHKNLAFIGRPGTGKTHLAQAFGRTCCEHGFRSYFIKMTELRDRMTSARRSGRESNLLSYLVRPSCLIIDEVGHCEFDKENTRLFFDMVDRRYQKEGYSNMVFTSNRDPAQWKENFCENDALLCALDRIFDDAVVFTIKGESFRGRKLETVALRTSAGSPADPQQAG